MILEYEPSFSNLPICWCFFYLLFILLFFFPMFAIGSCDGYKDERHFSSTLVVNKKELWLILRDPSFPYKIFFGMEYDDHSNSFDSSSGIKLWGLRIIVNNNLYTCSKKDQPSYDYELVLTTTLVLSFSNPMFFLLFFFFFFTIFLLVKNKVFLKSNYLFQLKDFYLMKGGVIESCNYTA